MTLLLVTRSSSPVFKNTELSKYIINLILLVSNVFINTNLLYYSYLFYCLICLGVEYLIYFS